MCCRNVAGHIDGQIHRGGLTSTRIANHDSPSFFAFAAFAALLLLALLPIVFGPRSFEITSQSDPADPADLGAVDPGMLATTFRASMNLTWHLRAANAVAGRAATVVKTHSSICGRGIGLRCLLRDCSMFLLNPISAATATTTHLA